MRSSAARRASATRHRRAGRRARRARAAPRARRAAPARSPRRAPRPMPAPRAARRPAPRAGGGAGGARARHGRRAARRARRRRARHGRRAGRVCRARSAGASNRYRPARAVSMGRCTVVIRAAWLAALKMRVGDRVRGFGLSAEEQEQVWRLWGSGKSLSAVARAMGRHVTQVRRYVESTGGRRPACRRRSSGCLSAGEREEISRGLACGESCRQIAAGIARSHTTISREVRNNGGRRRYRAKTPTGWRGSARVARSRRSSRATCGCARSLRPSLS